MREECLRQRDVLAILKRADWQGIVNSLWRRWRWLFSDRPAPERPTAVASTDDVETPSTAYYRRLRG
jgi:hypothetical protein